MAEQKNVILKEVVTDAKPYQDGGHAWLVCLASFFGYFLVTMGICTSGLLYQEFQREFGRSNAQTAFIPSVQSSVGALLGVFISPQVKRYGCRSTTAFGTLLGTAGYILCSFATDITHMYMSLGLLVGVGNGFLFFSSAVSVQFYFNKRRALASALSTCGVSLAPFVFAPTVQWMLSIMSWRGVTLQMGAIYLHGFVSAGFMSHPPMTTECVAHRESIISGPENEHQDPKLSICEESGFDCTISHSDIKYTQVRSETEDAYLSSGSCQLASKCRDMHTGLIRYFSETFDLTLLTHCKFLLFVSASCLSLCGHLTTYLYLPIIVTSIGNNHVGNAAILISAIGVFTTVGRIISGVVGDHKLIASHRNVHYGLPMLFTGCSTVLAAFINSGWMFYLYSGVFGLCTGIYFVAQQPLLVQILGVGLFPKSFGIMLIFTGSTALLAQPFAGWLVDITHRPTTAFLVCGSLQAVGGILAMVTGRIKEDIAEDEEKVGN